MEIPNFGFPVCEIASIPKSEMGGFAHSPVAAWLRLWSGSGTIPTAPETLLRLRRCHPEHGGDKGAVLGSSLRPGNLPTDRDENGVINSVPVGCHLSWSLLMRLSSSHKCMHFIFTATSS